MEEPARPVGTARSTALSPLSRGLTWAMAIAYAGLGLVLLLAPRWSSERFPWVVSEFVAMTIGGWCMGNAVLAFEAARVWRWGAVYPLLTYLWWFGLLEVVVLVLFASKVKLDVTLGWPYIGALVLTVGAAVAGIADLVRLRPVRDTAGRLQSTASKAAWVAFVLFVGLVATVTWIAPPAARTGRYFPEAMTTFTLRAFSAFYASLVLSVIPLMRERSLAAGEMMATRAQGLIVFISLAWIVYIERFDFGRVRQWVYPTAYVVASVVAALSVAWSRHRAPAVDPAP